MKFNECKSDQRIALDFLCSAKSKLKNKKKNLKNAKMVYHILQILKQSKIDNVR